MKQFVRFAAIGAAVFYAACFSKPDAPNGVASDSRPADSMGSGSGSGSGSNVVGCPYDNFDGTGVPCGAWGVSFGSGGGITRTNGVLTDKPVMPSGNGTGCISNNAFDFSQGVSIDIQAILDGGMSYTTFFEVQNGAATSQFVRVNIQHTTGNTPQITTACSGTTIPATLAVPYDIAIYRFFQFKPSATPNAIDILARGSGGSFMPLEAAACTWSNSPATVKVRFGAYSSADVASTPAVFDSLSCP